MTNALYYGDNLDVLRDSVATESVDLIYLKCLLDAVFGALNFIALTGVE